MYSSQIHTVTLKNSSWEFSLPVIEVNTSQKLQLNFDDFARGINRYAYTLIHCDAGWHPSDIPQQEYLSGFTEGDIREYHASSNTTYDYVHFSLEFPEDLVQPVLSGNYVIVVYRSGDPEDIILTRRFYVLERLVEVEGSVRRPPPGEQDESGQLVQFTVSDPGHAVTQGGTALKALVSQNGRTDQSVLLDRPRQAGGNRYDFTYNERLIFAGGNEFRNFDIKSMKYVSEHIERIDFQNPYYHVYLKTDEARTGAYFFNPDLDGSFYIDRENAVDAQWDADYVYVHFSLAWPYPFDLQSVYVTGALTNWKRAPFNKMEYNFDRQRYELTLLLKQGWYDYMYLAADPYSAAGSLKFEGSHYETQNTYIVYIYDPDPTSRYTRLIGLTTLSTP